MPLKRGLIAVAVAIVLFCTTLIVLAFKARFDCEDRGGLLLKGHGFDCIFLGTEHPTT